MLDSKIRWLVAAVPLLLIATVIVAFTMPGCFSEGAHGLKAGETYAVWIAEAEVAPVEGAASAPDLVALMEWQNQVILKTVVSRNSLIARWEPVGVSVGQVLEGEVSTSSVQRVARVRLTPGGTISVGVFDRGLLHRELIGGFTVPLENLRLGVNEIPGGNRLRRVQLAVTRAESGAVADKSQWVVSEGVQPLQSAPSIMQDDVTRLSERIGTLTGELAADLRKELEPMMNDAAKRIEQDGKSTKDWMDKKLPETRKELEKGLDEAVKGIEESGREAKEWLEKNLPGTK